MIESETHRRLAALCRSNGDAALALAEEYQAKTSAALEAQVLPKFERIYVTSAIDREKLAAKHVRGEFCVSPNSVRLPVDVPPRPPAGPFLFVGTLGYYPNEDACRYLRSEIVPRLAEDFEYPYCWHWRHRTPAALTPILRFKSLERSRRSIAWYHNAAAVVVPVRAGGGTRIKILEAFSFRRPVITTAVGVEGIDARHDESILVADTPEEFAEACRRLRHDYGLGERLAGECFQPAQTPLFRRGHQGNHCRSF